MIESYERLVAIVQEGPRTAELRSRYVAAEPFARFAREAVTRMRATGRRAGMESFDLQRMVFMGGVDLGLRLARHAGVDTDIPILMDDLLGIACDCILDGRTDDALASISELRVALRPERHRPAA